MQNRLTLTSTYTASAKILLHTKKGLRNTQPFVLRVKLEELNLAFRELKAPARFAFTVFFTLNNTAVPR